VTTRADGSFRLDGIATTTHHVLLLRHDECEWLVTPFPDDEATRTEIDLGTIRVGRGAVVAGVVADDRGTPMACAYVNLATDGGVAGGVHCDAHGHFELEGVPAGRATLTASVDGFKEPAQLVLDVEDESVVESVALTIPTGLSIAGRVTDVTGAPSVRAVVLLHSSSTGGDAKDSIVASARTDADGRFRFAGLAAGAYRLDVRAEKSGEMRSAPKRIDHVDAGTNDLVVVLADDSFATGRVVDGAGEPIIGAWLTLTDPGGKTVAAGDSGRDGIFKLAAPPDLELRLEARVFDPRHPGPVMNGPVAASLDHVRAGGAPVTLVVANH
jgi:protocatechuate 3,4-dioxygenase beta subunit